MAFKIEGGSFGLDGRVKVDLSGRTVEIAGAVPRTYAAAEIAGVEVDKDVKSKTSVISVLIGLLVFTPLLAYFFGVGGLIVGLVLTVFGSRYTKSKYLATIRFSDGKTVRVAGGQIDINRLPRLVE